MIQLADAIDWVVLDINAEMGDDMQGAAVTYGRIITARSADDLFHSDLVLIWSGNPAYTQIPNFHFRTEVFNGVGRFLVKAKVSPAIRPGQVVTCRRNGSFRYFLHVS